MSTILSFLGKSSNRVERFERLKKSKSKEEVRKLEQALLEPEPIPEYTKEQPTNKGMHALAVKLFFNEQKDYDLFCKHFKVSQYIEASCYQLDILLALLKALEKGRLVYDEEKRKLIRRKSSNH